MRVYFAKLMRVYYANSQQYVNNEINRSLGTGDLIDSNRIQQIAGCNRTTLTRYKLNKKIVQAKNEQELQLKSYYYKLTKEFVEEANKNKEKFTFEQYFIHINRSKKWMKSRFPDLLINLDQLMKDNRRVVDQARCDELLEKAKEIVIDMYKNGEPARVRVIKQKISKRYYLFDHDKDLRNKVKDLLNKVYR